MRPKVVLGIDGVDKMLNGGIPQGNQILLSGGPGAGKTLFSFEYLYKGALMGENGLLFSLEERPESIIENAKDAFSGFTDIDDLVKAKKLVVYNTDDIRTYLNKNGGGARYAFGKLVSDIESAIDLTGAKRVVIDSLSIIKLLLINDELEYRNVSMDLITALRNKGVTTLLTVEVDVADKSRLYFQPEFFIYDGIIMMYSSDNDGANRIPTMEVIKMRGTKHSRTTVPYEITTSGIGVLLLAGRESR